MLAVLWPLSLCLGAQGSLVRGCAPSMCKLPVPLAQVTSAGHLWPPSGQREALVHSWSPMKNLGCSSSFAAITHSPETITTKMITLHTGGCDSYAALTDVFFSPWDQAEDDAPEGDMPSLYHIPGTVLGNWGGHRGDLGSVSDIKFIYWTKYDTELPAHTYAHAYTITQCCALSHRMYKAHTTRRKNGNGEKWENWSEF